MFNFAQKELAPKASEIDKKNQFDDLKVKIWNLNRNLSTIDDKIYHDLIESVENCGFLSHCGQILNWWEDIFVLFFVAIDKINMQVCKR